MDGGDEAARDFTLFLFCRFRVSQKYLPLSKVITITVLVDKAFGLIEGNGMEI